MPIMELPLSYCNSMCYIYSEFYLAYCEAKQIWTVCVCLCVYGCACGCVCPRMCVDVCVCVRIWILCTYEWMCTYAHVYIVCVQYIIP